MKPSLGVVIPTRNRVDMLERAIASVPTDVEIVVVDDASSDGTPAFLSGLRAKVCSLRMRSSMGPCAARNAGIALSTARHLLFLDDDDVLLSGGVQRILEVCAIEPDILLQMHNCEWSDGSMSIPRDTPVTRIDYEAWLGGELAGELKPVARRDLFDGYRFENTGAGGEGLLWGRVIKELGAIASGEPIVRYNVGHQKRLTSVSGLIERAECNALIADRWLELFGEDQRRVAPTAWVNRVLAAAFYHALSAHPSDVRRLAHADGLPPRQRAVIASLSVMPRPILRAIFRARARVSTSPQRNRRFRTRA